MKSLRHDLPFGTAPSTTHAYSLADVSYLNEDYSTTDVDNPSSRKRSNTVTSGKVLSLSGSSTFSCAGDPLPDEVEGDDGTATVTINKEFQALRDMATIVARQRGVSIDDVLPSLVGLFTGTSTSTSQALPEPSPEQFMPQYRDSQAQTTVHQSRRLLPALSESNLLVLTHDLDLPIHAADSIIESVVADDVSRQLPKAYIRKGRRPFSFEPGDDTMGARREKEGNLMGDPGLQPISASSSREATPRPSLRQYRKVSSGHSMSSSPTDGRRPSKIPSPAQEHPMGQPRREASTSSVCTTILYPRVDTSRPVSESNSLRGGGTVVHRESDRASKVASNRSSASSMSVGGQRVTDPKSSLRNSTAALAAARAAESGSRRSSRSATESVRKHSSPRPSESGT